VTYEPQGFSEVKTPSATYTFQGYVAYVYSYGKELIVVNASSVPPILQVATGLGNELPSATVSMIGGWSVNVQGYQGSSMYGNYLVVSNKSSTFVIDVQNGNIISSANVNGLILEDSTLVIGSSLYQVVGETADGTGSTLVVFNLTTKKYTTFHAMYSGYYLEGTSFYNDYIMVSGVQFYPPSLAVVILNSSGAIVYSNITSE
ncbi:MAG: hypothetical protein K1T65_09885, partial [Candidatus Aramenus sp.]|nr:hypothetical protein [Candidatus Aramenus sp.]